MGRQRLTESHWLPDTSRDLLNMTLGDLLRSTAAEVPDRVALVDGVADPNRRRWTYAQTLDLAERAARGLLQRFQPGDRVGIFAANSPEWFLLQHAVSLAGLVLVPVNPAYTARELEHVLGSSGAVGLIFAEGFRGRNLRTIAQDVQTRLPGLRELISITSFDALVQAGDATCAAEDEKRSANRTGFLGLWKTTKKKPSAAPAPLPKVTPDQMLQMQYTSGTTGSPKGACLHHRGVINTSRNVALRSGFPEGGVWINAMPMFHIAGDVVAAMGALAQKGSFVLMPEFNAELMLQLIEEERCNHTLIVPTMILELIDHPTRPQRDCSSLITILSGAANVSPALIRQTQDVFGCNLCNIFGQTESNGPITVSGSADTEEDRAETVGCPLPHAEVRIVDPTTEATVPIGEIGEIWVRGYQTMSGYFGLPEATEAALRPGGWLRTGDLGSLDERGYLRITGRLKEMIIRGGMHLYPAEIEDVLFTHPAVKQVSVIGLPDERWGEIVAAVIQLHSPNQAPSVDELFAYCREHLAAHKTPAQWFFVESYPLTPTGKVQKHILADWIRDNQITPVEWTKPVRA